MCNKLGDTKVPEDGRFTRSGNGALWVVHFPGLCYESKEAGLVRMGKMTLRPLHLGWAPAGVSSC